MTPAKKYQLPNMEKSFEIQTTGDETGVNWVGKFLYRRPTLRERAQIDVLRAKLNGDMTTLDRDIMAYNEAIAHLNYTLRETPAWWKELGNGDALYDANVIMEVYTKCLEFEATWRASVHGGKADDVEAGREIQPS